MPLQCITANSPKTLIILHVQPSRHDHTQVQKNLQAFSSAMQIIIMQPNERPLKGTGKTGTCETADSGLAQSTKHSKCQTSDLPILFRIPRQLWSPARSHATCITLKSKAAGSSVSPAAEDRPPAQPQHLKYVPRSTDAIFSQQNTLL